MNEGSEAPATGELPDAGPPEEPPPVLDESPSAPVEAYTPPVPESKRMERKVAVVKTPPAPASARPPLRRWIRSLSSALAVALAFVVGDLVAAFVPGAALRFDSATAGIRGVIGGALSPAGVAAFAIVVVLVLYVVLVGQAGKPRPGGFLIPAVALCLGSAGAGFHPVGGEVEGERRSAALENEAASLRAEIGRLKGKFAPVEARAARADDFQKRLDVQQKAAEGASTLLAAGEKAMAKAVELHEQKLREHAMVTQEAVAERDKAVATLNLTLKEIQKERKERDDALALLRQENEELRKKLAERK